jgi:hypothetical protein
VDVGEEVELEAAHAFSQAAFQAERTILDIVDVHSRAMQELSGRAASSGTTVTAAGFSYLAEALSTFEMTQREDEPNALEVVQQPPPRGESLTYLEPAPGPMGAGSTSASCLEPTWTGDLVGMSWATPDEQSGKRRPAGGR